MSNEDSNNLLETVRARTRAVHQEIESDPFFKALSAGTLNELQYAAKLRFDLAMLETFEAQWANSPDERIRTLAAATASKVGLLRLDLGELTPPPWLEAEMETFQDGLDVLSRTPASWAGPLYVFEGSSLGGLRLAPLIESSLSRGRSITRFLRVYGTGKGSQWKRVVSLFDSFDWSAQEHDAVADAAEWTFAMARQFAQRSWGLGRPRSRPSRAWSPDAYAQHHEPVQP